MADSPRADIVPMLRDRGVSDAAINQMLILNPRALFENNQPY